MRNVATVNADHAAWRRYTATPPLPSSRYPRSVQIRILIGALIVMLSAAACSRHAPVASGAPAAGAAAAGPAAASDCLPDRSGYLRLRARGAQNLDLDWRDADLQCDGGPRPGQGGLRVTFAAHAADGAHQPRLVFGIAALPGAGSSHAVPANVTLILEGEGRIYSTRGDDKCTIDELVQTPLAPPAAAHSYRVVGRGFCVAPASSLDGREDVLLSRFDFAGRMLDDSAADRPQ